MAGRGVPHRQAGLGVDRAGQDEGEHRQAARRDDPDRRGRRSAEGQGRRLAPHPQQADRSARKAQHRRDEHPRIAAVVVHPGARGRFDRRTQRVGRARRIDHAGDAEAHVAEGHHGPADGEQHQAGYARDRADGAGAFQHIAFFALDRQPGGAVQHQHRHRQQAAQQGEGREQAQQAAFIEAAQVAGQAEGRADEDVADRYAEHQGREEAADEQAPVPHRAPARLGPLGAVFERHRPQYQRGQHQEHRQIEAREADGVDLGPGGEDRRPAHDQPDLVAFPGRADGVDHHATLFILLGDEGQQGADAHVEPVGQGEADQQHAQQSPPDQAEGGVVEGEFHLSFSFNDRVRRPRARLPRGRLLRGLPVRRTVPSSPRAGSGRPRRRRGRRTAG